MMKPVLKADNETRAWFKKLNPLMIVFWRLGLGNWINIWPEKFGQIMILTHHGRKSGKLRRTPVNYADINGDIYITAGFGSISDWYRNLQADPKVELWLPDSWWAGEAEEITDPHLRIPILRQVLIASGFATYAAGIDPFKTSDDELESLTQGYRLIRIRKTAPRTGPGGPGDLSWVWIVTTLFLLVKLLSKHHKKR